MLRYSSKKERKTEKEGVNFGDEAAASHLYRELKVEPAQNLFDFFCYFGDQKIFKAFLTVLEFLDY